ncbi:hypothetical protein K443DRAFT_622360 [Laccaria amethystina LaAM-08-1]|uniref:Uncharacterized protein n=1 Tax=Laccaria amethystina LaAM-08-1 TaxID=1095629 RepID=A0A0C9Y1W7_9AGAR|nr:hypothetical protein K443DRAFT_622360 [Laccaria amethystina LaAM-08-1]
MFPLPAYFVGTTFSACSRDFCMTTTKLPNIKFCELPVRMEGDSDGTKSKGEWPSLALDHGRKMESHYGRA